MVARVVAYDPVVPAEVVIEQGVEPVEFPELLRVSDYISIHCPLTSQTRHLFNANTLSQMKPTAWLINTARGEIIDEDALTDALRQGRIGGAALDVLTHEPPSREAPLLQFENVIVTPHVAYYSKEAIADLQRLAAEEVRLVLTGGQPRSLVNRELLAESGK
jgi:D-3-phosphoglycerate dehydrogenase